LTFGFGTREASFAMESRGSNITWNELLHGVFIHTIQLQVAVFCVTFQYTLAFRKAGYALALLPMRTLAA
jgi:hypothetical protein